MIPGFDSLNMGPASALANPPSDHASDAELARQVGIGRPIGLSTAHLPNAVVRQLGQRVCCPWTTSPSSPPLAVSVVDVVGCSAKEKVVGAHAPRVVASMTDVEARGVRLVRHPPRESVRQIRDAFDAEAPVPASVHGPLPVPATICLLDLRPKSVFPHPHNLSINSRFSR